MVSIHSHKNVRIEFMCLTLMRTNIEIGDKHSKTVIISYLIH